VTLRSVSLVTVAFFAIGCASGLLDVLINVEGSAIEQLRGARSCSHAWGLVVGAAVGSASVLLRRPRITPSPVLRRAVLIGVVALVSARPSRWPTRAGRGSEADRMAKVRQCCGAGSTGASC